MIVSQLYFSILSKLRNTISIAIFLRKVPRNHSNKTKRLQLLSTDKDFRGILYLLCEYAKEMDIKLSEILLMKGEGNGHILRRFCTYFKMRRNCTYSKKVLYIFSINAKDLRRCEGCAKEIYTPENSQPRILKL